MSITPDFVIATLAAHGIEISPDHARSLAPQLEAVLQDMGVLDNDFGEAAPAEITVLVGGKDS